MMLRLSVNRCGFDIGPAELRTAIADLNRLAGEIGEVIGMLNASVCASPEQIRARVSALRQHRIWLKSQAEFLEEKLEAHRKRAEEQALRDAVQSQSVTLFPLPAALSTRADRVGL